MEVWLVGNMWCCNNGTAVNYAKDGRAHNYAVGGEAIDPASVARRDVG